MVNKVILVGNLGHDPEHRSTPSGHSVVNFSVATSRRWRDRDGNKQEATEWHNVVVWGKQAEIAANYLHKGKRVYIEGRLQTDSWDDKETGQKRYKTQIVCETFQMLGGGLTPEQRQSFENNDSAAPSTAYDPGAEDDDIPF